MVFGDFVIAAERLFLKALLSVDDQGFVPLKALDRRENARKIFSFEHAFIVSGKVFRVLEFAA